MSMPNINNYRNANVKKSAIFIIGISAFVITMDFNALSGYEFQFLLPLNFSVLYIIFAPSIKNFGMGYLVLNGVWVIRYCITPVLNRLSNYDIRFYANVSNENLYTALVLMLVELWVSMFTCYVFYKRHHQELSASPKNKTKSENSHFDETLDKVGILVGLVIFGMVALVLAVDRSALDSFNFILNYRPFLETSSLFGTSVIIIELAMLILAVFVIQRLAFNETRRRNTFNIVISFLVVLFLVSIVTGDARNQILVKALAFIHLLIIVFPEYKKRIYTFGITSVILVILSVTVVRFFNTNNLVEGLSNFDVSKLSRTFNAYFAGQQNVAIGVKSISVFWAEYDIRVILKDIFANTILINRFVENFPGTVQKFNIAIYSHELWADQIPPTITQAVALFNVFGFLIPSAIVWHIMKMDMTTRKAKNIFEIFTRSYISIYLAFFSPGSITILSTAFFNYFIPLYLIYKLSLIKNSNGRVDVVR